MIFAKLWCICFWHSFNRGTFDALMALCPIPTYVSERGDDSNTFVNKKQATPNRTKQYSFKFRLSVKLLFFHPAASPYQPLNYTSVNGHIHCLYNWSSPVGQHLETFFWCPQYILNIPLNEDSNPLQGMNTL